ncbi:4,5-dihydroxyphthalate decarboxylase [Monaibacterium marinum]|uniref:4,5-dihydroxyphthalate decarboxylase n=1 Tax=Pontivivens marinum TaxID=1690039 RepID=A0A2C9CRS2_9RHOB|nr:ABC transporter substrate-binding protein [Monaibacterium marinum]SOH93903.1 4,5-dihydroxyphthalate decarboxylase [Monaibacterium marinum]
MLNIRLAVRDWDYLTPLALGEVTSSRISIELDRVGTLPATIAGDTGYDGGEASLSRFISGIASGDRSTVGLPNFLMRSFRHQCIITRKDSPLTRVTDLVGKRIGVTGWRDSGNIWTRAILRQAGAEIEDVRWYAGRLTEAHPIIDRLDGFGQPGLIEPMPDEAAMMTSLADGWLDAVFTPFMPDGFFENSSQFRLLLPDCTAQQVAYYGAVGYVPGIHLLSLDAELVQKAPWVTEEVSRMVDASRAIWTQKRRRYADTTPFMLQEMIGTAASLPTDWAASGMAKNRDMICAFIAEMQAQNILQETIEPETIFASQASASELAL